jgi:uncharacterized protein YndB with AHSA1/START domain
MVRSAVVVAIDRPIEQVFAFVANAETAPQWREEIVDVRRTTAGPIGVGTTYQALHTHLGERAASTLEITEYEPNRKVSFEGLTGPGRFRDSYAFQSVGASTRVTYGFDLATQGHGARSVSSRQAADLSKLKLLLEAQGSAAGPAPRAAEVQSPRAGARSVEDGRSASRQAAEPPRT